MSDHENETPTDLKHRIEIDRICDQFEAFWKNAELPPDLRVFMQKMEGETVAGLACELILLDRDYRQQKGFHAAKSHYHDQFPDDIERAFSDGAKSMRVDQTLDPSPLATIDSDAPLSPIDPHLIQKRIRYFGDFKSCLDMWWPNRIL